MPEIQLPAGVSRVASLSGHSGPVGQIAWAPTGNRLASTCKDGTVRIWDTDTGRHVHTIRAHAPKGARAVAFSPDGRLLASGGDDDHVRLWDPETYKPLATYPEDRTQQLLFDQANLLWGVGFYGARSWDTRSGEIVKEHPISALYANKIAITHRGAYVAVCEYETGVQLWNAETAERHAWIERRGARALAAHPLDDALVVGDDEGLLQLWRPSDGELITTWEGHTTGIRSISYSFDGRFLASKAFDEVRVWETSTGHCLARIPIASGAKWVVGVSFHPSTYRFAVSGLPMGEGRRQGSDAELDEADRLIHVLELDPDALSTAVRAGVRYTSAKVVLVGESGVGKTGLGWRIAHGEFKEHESTHGQQFWAVDELRHSRTDGTECEAVLWDLAGQPDYRLVHALFLDDADLALVVFDPTRDDDPLRGVEYWLKQLGSDRRIVLVAARADRGTARLTDAEIEAFCAARGVSGSIVTSARSGEGLAELVERVRTLIPWDAKSATVTTETFKRIKDRVLALRADATQRVIVTAGELRSQLERDAGIGSFSDAEMLTAVGHLSNHGYVAGLTTSNGEARVLLAPELLNNVAASIVLEARRSERSLGSLEEHRVLTNDYRFRELETLDREDREVLLDSAVAMFLAHNVCFRETDPLNSRAYLVFPDLINLKKPSVVDEHPLEDGVGYTVSGAIENVYASLVVLLGYTSTFARTNQWRDQAQYVVGDGWICGFRLETAPPGELNFVLYFGTDVGEPVRGLFQGLFESFLARRELSVRRYEAVVCANGHRLNRAVIREALDADNECVFCNRCGDRLPLTGVESEIQLAKADATLVEEKRTAGARSRFEQVLFRLNAHVVQERLTVPECFISYAWGDSDHERWVEVLANDLTKAGLTVILDRWENAKIGSSVSRFIERVHSADRVIVVGTSDYRRKYDNGDAMRGFVAAAEGDLIGARMLGTESAKETVLPVLLEGDTSSFPALLQGRVRADFRDPDAYFATMLALVLSLYEIDPRTPVAVELRSLLAS